MSLIKPKQNLTPEIRIVGAIEISKSEASLMDGGSLPFSRNLASKINTRSESSLKSGNLAGCGEALPFMVQLLYQTGRGSVKYVFTK